MKNIIFTIVLLLSVSLGTSVALAQTGTASGLPTCGTNCNLKYTPLEPLPGGFDNRLTDSNQYLSAYITSGFKLAMLLGGLTAVVMLILGGMSYMFSEVSPENKGKAKKRIIAALWGLTILLGAYLLLNTINPQLVNFRTLFFPTGGLNGGGGSGVTAGATGGTTGGTGATGGACTATGPGTCQDTQCRAASGNIGCALNAGPNGTWNCVCG